MSTAGFRSCCSASCRSCGSVATGGVRAAPGTVPTPRASRRRRGTASSTRSARVLDMVPWVAWLAAAFALVRAIRERNRVLLGLAGVAAAWSVLVVATSAVFGYAALSRFLLPAAAVVCVLAGVGAVWAVTSLWRRSTLVTVVVVALAGRRTRGARCPPSPSLVDERRDARPAGTGSRPRDRARRRRRHGRRLRHRSRSRPPTCRGVASCGSLALPLAEVERSLPDRGGVMFVTHGTEARRQARLERRFGADAVTVLARSSDWIVLAVGCGRPG